MRSWKVEKHLRKRKYTGQREKLIKDIPRSKVLHTIDELEAAVFVALIEKTETVPFIVDCLDPVRPFPAEEEQGIAVRIKPEAESCCFMV